MMNRFFAGSQCQRKTLLACLLVGTTAVSLTTTNAKPTVIVFDPPDSIATTSRVISNRNVTGYYQDIAGLYHGFVRTEDGVITVFDVGVTNTYAASIDESG